MIWKLLNAPKKRILANCSSRLNTHPPGGDALGEEGKTLANRQGIVYNQYRNNQRIFALSDGCHRKLLNMVYELCRLSPIGVEDSHFIFCGGCQGTIKPRTRPTITSKLLTYSYVPPFLFPERQPPDYPHIVLI